MKNILTIYKFNFPFLFNSFEKTKYKAIVSDLKQLLLYDEIYKDCFVKKFETHEVLNLNFNGGKINIIYYFDNQLYFLPQFQLDLYLENNNENLILNIIKIFETIGLKEYIIDLDYKKNIISNFTDIITIKILEKNFKKYNYNSLQNFLNNTPLEYLDEKLQRDYLIRNSFYYMIYLCFLYFKNSIDSKENIKEIKKMLSLNTFVLYKGNLELGRKKLNLVNFKKYKLMLDKLFDIFK